MRTLKLSRRFWPMRAKTVAAISSAWGMWLATTPTRTNAWKSCAAWNVRSSRATTTSRRPSPSRSTVSIRLAEEALNWTRENLNDDDKKYLNELRLVRQVRDFTIVHATLDTPHKWGYVFNQLDASASFSYQHTSVCFFGHTHAPRAYIRDGPVMSIPLDKIKFEMGKKYFINIGSVGQPRDGDWRAAYVIYHIDKNFIELRRLEYDIQTRKRKILAAGLPKASCGPPWRSANS